jgi:hypothetical protein
MQTTVHRPLKFIAFNANGIGRQAYVARKHLQDLKIDVALFSQTNLKPHMRFYIPNYDFCPTDPQEGHKRGSAAAVRKGILHNCVELSPVLPLEVTRVCIPIGHIETVLSAVYKYPQSVCINPDITELLRFRNKSILADDLNADHPAWKSTISYSSDLKHMELFITYNFKISAPQCSTHYTTDGSLRVVHHNFRLSEIIFILDSDHLQILFSILDPVRTRKALDQFEKLTDWQLFQNLASEFIYPNIQIHSSNKAEKQ